MTVSLRNYSPHVKNTRTKISYKEREKERELHLQDYIAKSSISNTRFPHSFTRICIDCNYKAFNSSISPTIDAVCILSYTLVRMLQSLRGIAVDDFRGGDPSPSIGCDKKYFIEVLETSELSMLAFKNGGRFGEGMTHSLSVSIWTTSVIDGLTAREACVHRSPIRSTSDASLSGNPPFKMGSTASVIFLAL